MKLVKLLFVLLLFGIGLLGVFEAIVADLQNKDGVFVGGYFTGINLLTFVGIVMACMGFGGAFLIARSKL